MDMLEGGGRCVQNTTARSPRWRWRGFLKQSDLITLLSGATSPEQVRENTDALTIALTDEGFTINALKWR